jgi:hypothetical protein
MAKTLANRLESMNEDQLNYGEGQALFMILWRLKEHRPGNPSYPEIDPKVVLKLIKEILLIFGEAEDHIPVDCVKSGPDDPIPDIYG